MRAETDLLREIIIIEKWYIKILRLDIGGIIENTFAISILRNNFYSPIYLILIVLIFFFDGKVNGQRSFCMPK